MFNISVMFVLVCYHYSLMSYCRIIAYLIDSILLSNINLVFLLCARLFVLMVRITFS